MQNNNKIKNNYFLIVIIAAIYIGIAIDNNSKFISQYSFLYISFIIALSVYAIFKEKIIYKHNSNLKYFTNIAYLTVALLVYLIVKQVFSYFNSELLIDRNKSLFEIYKIIGISAAFYLGFNIARNKNNGKNFLDLLIFAGGMLTYFLIILYLLLRFNNVTDSSNANYILITNFMNSYNASIFYSSICALSYTSLIRKYVKAKNFNMLNTGNIIPAFTFFSSLVLIALTENHHSFASVILVLVISSFLLLSKKFTLIENLLYNLLFGSTLLILSHLARNVIFVEHPINEFQSLVFLKQAYTNLFGIFIGQGSGKLEHTMQLLNPDMANSSQNYIGVLFAWFVEFGLFGVIIILALNYNALIILFRNIIYDNSNSTRIIGILSVYFVFLISGLFGFDFKEPFICIYLATLVGVGTSFATVRS